MIDVHLSLRTLDLKAMESFYINLLSFKLLDSMSDEYGRFDLTFLSDNDVPKLEIVRNWDDTELPAGRAMFHYGFYVSNYQEVLGNCKKMGAPILEENLVNDKRQFYTKDPEGNFVEVTEK